MRAAFPLDSGHTMAQNLERRSNKTCLTRYIQGCKMAHLHQEESKNVTVIMNSGWFFWVATTLVDLLFIELMSHLSHVKQMYSQSIHLTHELILCIQITRGRIHARSESGLSKLPSRRRPKLSQSLAGRQDMNLGPLVGEYLGLATLATK